jgi:chromosome segregation ATPase
MEEKYNQKFNDIYENLNESFKEITNIKATLETKRNKGQIKIDKYESKSSLTERQEEILDDLYSSSDDLENEIEQLDEFIEHIGEAMGLICFDIESLEKYNDFLKNQIT